MSAGAQRLRNTPGFGSVRVPIQVLLGETAVTVTELAALGEGTILELDRLAGEPVSVLASGHEVARGEVVVIDEAFGVRITRVLGRDSWPVEGR